MKHGWIENIVHEPYSRKYGPQGIWYYIVDGFYDTQFFYILQAYAISFYLIHLFWSNELLTQQFDYDNMAKQFPVYDALYTFCKSDRI